MLLAPWLALQGALSYECTISFHPGRGAPGAAQQGQWDRGQGLGTQQQRDLKQRGRGY